MNLDDLVNMIFLFDKKIRMDVVKLIKMDVQTK